MSTATLSSKSQVVLPAEVRRRLGLRPGDRLYCMACMTRIRIVAGEDGRLETQVLY